MAFTWKDKADKYKGEGIYHLTFVVANRIPLLGTLRPLETPDSMGHIAWTDGTEMGRYVYQHFNELKKEYPQMQILAKQIMPNHFHAVVWMHEGFEGSIKMVARGFAQGCSKEARRLEVKRKENQTNREQASLPLVNAQYASTMPLVNAQSNCAVNNSIAKQSNIEISTRPLAQTGTDNPYDCGNGANTLFEKPFIRTLAHSGQLQAMIRYTKGNPDNAWLVKMNPSMYVIHRDVEVSGLHFDTMGKSRLLDWPDKQVIALSRSLTTEQIADEVNKALRMAESGTVTYTAAINAGEKAVAKAVREAGYPLVVMMLDGFPPAGTEAARYYHPGGVYHKTCATGKLLLMAPKAGNYHDSRLIDLTDVELLRKAEAKHQYYTPLPHTSKRWVMIAGNMMLKMIAGLST